MLIIVLLLIVIYLVYNRVGEEDFEFEPSTVGAGDFHYDPGLVDQGSFTNVMSDYEEGY